MDFERYAVIMLDCYGTLIDWEAGILGAVRPVLESHGVDATDEEILESYAVIEAKQEAGAYVRYEVLLRLVMTELSLRLGFDATFRELDCVWKSIKDWRPFGDTVDALAKLKRKYKLAVISNVDDVLFRASERQLGIDFDWVITAEQAQAYKPSARMFEHALGRIGQPREKVLHVAQSLYHDIAPASDLGLDTIWVNRRAGKPGPGATPPATAEPTGEVADLGALVAKMGLQDQ